MCPILFLMFDLAVRRLSGCIRDSMMAGSLAVTNNTSGLKLMGIFTYVVIRTNLQGYTTMKKSQHRRVIHITSILCLLQLCRKLRTSVFGTLCSMIPFVRRPTIKILWLYIISFFLIFFLYRSISHVSLTTEHRNAVIVSASLV